jgi:hypothetical protein
MAKFFLSIATNYLRVSPSWAIGHEVNPLLREFISNAHDAKVMHGAQVSVTHDGKKKLTVESRGAVLSRRNMMLGGGDKFGRTDVIGKFEEGSKLALLVAAREGVRVKVRTGDEVWVPSIEPNKQFDNEESLVITTAKQAFDNAVRVEIEISAEEWAVQRKNFLFLMSEEETGLVRVGRTGVLKHPSMVGRVYVKGVFVQAMQDLAFGYDLDTANVDRDRRMVDEWDAKYEMSQALVSLAADKKIAKKLYEQAKAGRPEGSGYGITQVGGAAQENLLEIFDAEFGSDAVACRTAAEVASLRYAGVNAAVVPDKLREAVERKRGNAATVLARVLSTPEEIVHRDTLSDEERSVLDEAVAIVAGAGIENVAGTVDVAVFRDPKVLGKICNDMVCVSRQVLGSVPQTVRVLVHEFAHRDSGATDGTVAHTQAVEEIWQAVWERSFGR